MAGPAPGAYVRFGCVVSCRVQLADVCGFPYIRGRQTCVLGKFKFGTGLREVGESQGIDGIWGRLSELPVVQQKVIKCVPGTGSLAPGSVSGANTKCYPWLARGNRLHRLVCRKRQCLEAPNCTYLF